MKFRLLILFCIIAFFSYGQVKQDTLSIRNGSSLFINANKDSSRSLPLLPREKVKGDWNDREWNIKISYSYQKYQVISLGIGRLGQPVFMGSCGTDPNGGDGFSLLMQAYYGNGNAPLYAPAISWEASWCYFFKGIIEASYVTNFHKGDLYVKPEIGLNFLMLFYVVYGYDIGLTNNLKNTGLGKSCITIGADIPFWL